MARLKMRLVWLGKASLVLVTVAALAALGCLFMMSLAAAAVADVAS